MVSKIDEKRDSTLSTGSAGSAGSEDARPPSYAEQAPRQEPPPDLSARLASLNLNPISKVIFFPSFVRNVPNSVNELQNGVNVTPDQCIAHLKLLEAFYQLREDVGNTENLFGIASPDVDSKSEKVPDPTPEEPGQNPVALAQVRVREKRWAVYVARAVDRFEKWWDACVPATLQGAPCEKLTGNVLCTKKGLDGIAYLGRPIVQLGSKDQLPPLGTNLQ